MKDEKKRGWYGGGTTFADWMRNSHPVERTAVAVRAGVAVSWMKRLARGSVGDPPLNKTYNLCVAIAEYNKTQSVKRLPDVILSDFLHSGSSTDSA